MKRERGESESEAEAEAEIESVGNTKGGSASKFVCESERQSWCGSRSMIQSGSEGKSVNQKRD